jgi:hypothetical protein
MAGLIRLLLRRPGLFLGCFLLILATAVLLTGRLRFNQDILSLMPQEDISFEALSHIIQVSEGENRLYILLTDLTGRDDLAERAENVAETIAELRLDGRPAFKQVTSLKREAVSTRDFETLLADYLETPRLFLTASELEQIEDFLASPPKVRQEFQRSLALMATPGASRLGRLAAMDPLNLRRHLTPKLHSVYNRFDFAEGPHLLSPDGQAALLVAMPAISPADTEQARQLLRSVKQLGTDDQGLSIGLTGGFAIAVQQKSLMKQDFLGCLLGSAVLVTALFLITYRRLTVLAFVLLPLGVGLQLAMGVMALLWGQVHLISLAFAAVVLGLGIDFAIHLYDRYVLERGRGSPPEQSVSLAVLRTGKAVALGGLTTLSAFAVLTVTNSPVLQQIGWLVSLGLLFCLGTILLALPAWLLVSQRFPWGRSVPRLRRLGLTRPAAWIEARPGFALLLALTVLVLAGLGLPKLRFQTDLASLHPKGIEALSVQQDIQSHFGRPGDTVLLLWPADSPGQLRDREGLAVRGLEELSQSGAIRQWTSLSTFTGLQPSQPVEIDPSRLDPVLDSFGFSLSDFPATERFLQAVAQDETTALPGCRDGLNLPEILQRFVACTKDGRLLGLAWVQTAGPEATSRLNQAVSGLDGIRSLELDASLAMARDRIKGDVLSTAGLAGLCILALLWLYFRRLRLVWLALVPTGLGLAATFGLMGHLGLSINPVNFVLLPILLGIGLDDGIHLINRFQECGDLRATLTSTGRSIFMTTLTTSLGFGSLVLAQYHVLTQMGLLAIIGVISAFFFTLTGLAPLLSRTAAVTGRRIAPDQNGASTSGDRLPES